MGSTAFGNRRPAQARISLRCHDSSKEVRSSEERADEDDVAAKATESQPGACVQADVVSHRAGGLLHSLASPSRQAPSPHPPPRPPPPPARTAPPLPPCSRPPPPPAAPHAAAPCPECVLLRGRLAVRQYNFEHSQWEVGSTAGRGTSYFWESGWESAMLSACSGATDQQEAVSGAAALPS